MKTKYCPSCLRKCTETSYGTYDNKMGYACESCGILLYSNGIVLDTPDKEKQTDYNLRVLLRKTFHPSLDDDVFNDLVKNVKDLLTLNDK